MRSEKRSGISKTINYLTMKEVNPVVRFLTLSDIMIFSGTGLVSPIFAIFITESIPGGSIEAAGIATAVYAITKSVFQIPVANIIDRIKGEKDDFLFMVIGTLVSSLIPISYIFVNSVFQLYLVQFFYGIIIATTFPTWLALFTRHIDKDKEGTEWAIYQTLTDFSWAVFASLGGFMAARYGFDKLFILVAIINILGGLSLISVHHYLYKARGAKNKKK